MQLMLWSTINSRYFAKGSRPSQKDWEKAVVEGRVNGKVDLIEKKVFIDADDFLSRDDFKAVNDESPDNIDLLE